MRMPTLKQRVLKEVSLIASGTHTLPLLTAMVEQSYLVWKNEVTIRSTCRMD